MNFPRRQDPYFRKVKVFVALEFLSQALASSGKQLSCVGSQ